MLFLISIWHMTTTACSTHIHHKHEEAKQQRHDKTPQQQLTQHHEKNGDRVLNFCVNVSSKLSLRMRDDRP